MPILVIVLVAFAVFFGIGVLLIIGMFFETRRKALPDDMPNLRKTASVPTKRAA